MATRVDAIKARIRERKSESPIEQMVAVTLYRFGIAYRQQEPFPPFFADFFLPEVSLIIECDGAGFHLDKQKDAERDAYILQKYGVKTVRLTGSQIYKDCELSVWSAFMGEKRESYTGLRYRKHSRRESEYCPIRNGYYFADGSCDVKLTNATI